MKIGDTWIGEPPERCDICERPLMQVFVDGRTSDRRWAIMCPGCRVEHGLRELGTGRGQKFERTQASGWVWRKVAG